jgi:hypothetical protein
MRISWHLKLASYSIKSHYNSTLAPQVVVIAVVAALLAGIGSLVITMGLLLAPLLDLRQNQPYCYSVLAPNG